MLTNFYHIEWSDFNETEVDIAVLEGLDVTEISRIPHGKMIAIAHTLCVMLKSKGICHYMSQPMPKYNIESQKVSLDMMDDFCYLDYCSHARLREIIAGLIRMYPSH
jgi:hypothetical protein